MKITIVSPVKLTSTKQAGINIRIQGILNYLTKHGHRVILTDAYKPAVFKESVYVYCLISTKPDSITTKVINNLKPKNNLILDLYTPILLEKDLTYNRYLPTHWVSRRNQLKIIKHAVKSAIYFVVANKRQKSYWLSRTRTWGMKISKNNISVIPTSHNFHHKKSKNGKVILWFGGIYPWLEPFPLIKAFLKIAKQFPDWKIRILGGFYEGTGYNNLYDKFQSTLQKIDPEKLEIIPWQSPKNLPGCFKDVAFAVHLPKATQEDIYSHRVRLLTLLNSQIPILTSGKDTISKIVLKNKAGIKITGEADKLSVVLSKVINNPRLVNRMKKNTFKVEKEFLKEQLEDPIFGFKRTAAY